MTKSHSRLFFFLHITLQKKSFLSRFLYKYIIFNYQSRHFFHLKAHIIDIRIEDGEKMQVVYIDVLFIINFCMDFIALYISGSFLHIKRDKLLISLSALLGGAYAVFSIIFEGNKLLNFFIGIAVSFLLCYITYNKELTRARYLRLCAVFYFVSILLGGAITAFFNLLSSVFHSFSFESMGETENKMLLFVFLSLFSSALVMFFSRIFTKEISNISCKLTVTINGNSKTLDALIDSGNFLTEPISGKKVIIVNSEAIAPILSSSMIKAITHQLSGIENLHTSEAKRLRIIPVKAITGETIMTGYIPDSLKIERENKGKHVIILADAIIGFDVSKEKFAECDAIIPLSLL